MRIRRYEEKMHEEFGYTVMGSSIHNLDIGSCRDWDTGFAEDFAEIKMEIDWHRFPLSVCELSDVIDQEATLNIISEDDGVCGETFAAHYKEILLGEYPGFRVVGFQVHWDHMTIYLAAEDAHNYFCVVLKKTHSLLRIDFTGPKTVLGFCPKYRVSVSEKHYNSVKQKVFVIEEDCGYMRRKIELKLRDPQNPPEAYSDDNVFLDVTEYADF